MTFDKDKYRTNREAGKRGQDAVVVKKFFKAPDNIVMGFDNEGNMVAKTRAMRRRKLPTPNLYTKASHSIMKARKKK